MRRRGDWSDLTMGLFKFIHECKIIPRFDTLALWCERHGGKSWCLIIIFGVSLFSGCFIKVFVCSNYTKIQQVTRSKWDVDLVVICILIGYFMILETWPKGSIKYNVKCKTQSLIVFVRAKGWRGRSDENETVREKKDSIMEVSDG